MEDRRQGPAVETTYRTRLAERLAEAARLDRRHATLAWTRLVVFLAGAVLIAVLGRTSPPWIAVGVLIFIPLLYFHARTLNARDRATRAAAFYQRGIARLTDSWHGSGERGERFRNPHHLYAEDLDLFGAGGLFELLSTARTTGGEETLAQWLLAPAPPASITERHGAVAELATRLDLREDLAVLGPDVQAGVRTEDLKAWAAAPPQLRGTWPRAVAPVLSAISTGLIVQWIWTAQPPEWLVPALAVQGLFAWRFRHGVHHVAHGIEQREQELLVVATLMDRIEREDVTSPLLRAMRDDVRASGRSPAADVRRLARMVEIVSSGHNQIFAPIAALLLIGTQFAFAIERWRALCGPIVPKWLAAIAEYEALCAIATYAAEHPADPYPELLDGPACYDGEAMAHPLLPASTAIANDVRLGRDAPPLVLISGSNMSGKSTLLRTVGLNAVLAQAGAPVRARRLRMTPLSIGATLRIQDSLQAGRSRFFAEITRISAIVATSVPPTSVPAVLFLLDELLAGTNSHDRLQGATGILSGLVDRGAIGLATTHDLALTTMADGLGARAINVHFEDRFVDGALQFDYRLKPGVVRSSNAVALMRAVGLEV
ncbi:MAG TPA: hypothetical protein VNJ02_16525 [Vicinamibacterales bacterium]|nr:hypothetical protein [Vicinamibacterales bacterium]